MELLLETLFWAIVYTHVAVEKAMLWMKMEEAAPYNVERDSQRLTGLSTLLTGLSVIPLKTSAVSGSLRTWLTKSLG